MPYGTPFFFKLKAPDHAVAGFGFFVGSSVLPDSHAWELFGDGNGVSDFAALRARLDRIRRDGEIVADVRGRIGCSLIAEARLFSKSDWVAPPSDWKGPVQVGAGYDLAQGEGARVWKECLARAGIADPIALGPPPEIARDRFGKPVLYRPRLGQEIFRAQVLDAYGHACAVVGERSLPVLEAAHIKPYARDGGHEVSNGLALRCDLHRLFDRGYITVDTHFRLMISRRLKDDYEGGEAYYELREKLLTLPADTDSRPSEAAIAWHREHVFLG